MIIKLRRAVTERHEEILGPLLMILPIMRSSIGKRSYWETKPKNWENELCRGRNTQPRQGERRRQKRPEDDLRRPEDSRRLAMQIKKPNDAINGMSSCEQASSSAAFG